MFGSEVITSITEITETVRWDVMLGAAGRVQKLDVSERILPRMLVAKS